MFQFIFVSSNLLIDLTFFFTNFSQHRARYSEQEYTIEVSKFKMAKVLFINFKTIIIVYNVMDINSFDLKGRNCFSHTLGKGAILGGKRQ